MNGFIQSPPQLGNQYDEDRVLKQWLARNLSPETLQRTEGELRSMGELAVGELLAQQMRDRLREPTLTQWDPWGERIDEIELTPLWQQAHAIAAKSGLIATAYEGEHQPEARIIQFALVYLFHPSSDIYTCPLAMTDGAARALLEAGNEELIHRAVGHLTSRDPRQFWTSGQWMTETTGGSDVSGTETVARRDEQGQWRLYGRKWFTSAATSEMALALARPEGNPRGGAGLALFYLEPRDEQGRLERIRVLRLKDKLGTRKLPTAELELDGALATPVAGLDGGVRRIAPMLNITRTWNSVCAISFMRRAIALVRSYADRRVVFGRPLADQPLHQVTLAQMQAELEGGFHLVFSVIGLLGRSENGQLDEAEQRLLRLLVPIAKLMTGKQVVQVTSEAVEAFGGAGYVEDTGIPQLLRDAQVLPIWEGTTNVLSLDLLRVLREPEAAGVYLEALARLTDAIDAEKLGELVRVLNQRREALERRLGQLAELDDDSRQAGARNLALAMGRAYALALLAEHASHSLKQSRDPRPAAAARIFARSGSILLEPPASGDAAMLASDIYA